MASSVSLEIISLQGLATISLGDDVGRAQNAMHAIDPDSKYHHPTFALYSEMLGGQLQFTKADPQKLYQIVAGKPAIHVAGEIIIGERLEDALTRLGVARFRDTLWSIVDLESEFVGGVPIADSKRPRKASTKELIARGTLWIKSLGMGLVLQHGRVELICVRKPADVPQIGCGELSEIHLKEQVAPELFPSIPRLSPLPKQAPNRPRNKFRKRVVFSLLAIALIAFPAIVVYRDLTAWQKAIAVTGTVIDTRPAGPFPEEIDVRYDAVGGATYTVTIESVYTTARANGEQVDLLYRPEAPERAMTRIKIRDDGWSVHPYALFGSVLLATFCLVSAFPEYIRLNKRRR
jgi:hypothetical protein